MNIEQLRAELEAWVGGTLYADDSESFHVRLFNAYQAGWAAALQAQDREEIMEMALCESRHLMLRIGQAYRFVPMEGCKICEEMKAEHDEAYSIARLSR